jgi:Zn-dependent protease with chaperone function
MTFQKGLLFCLLFFYKSCFASCEVVGDTQIDPIFKIEMEGLCNRLSVKVPQEKSFVIFISEKDSDINAYAFEKGKYSVIYLTDSLLKIHSYNPRLLAFVVGHEMGHHSLGHVTETFQTKLVDRIKLAVSSAFGADALGYGNLAKFSIKSADNHYSRKQELDADAFSNRIVISAGFNKQDVMDSLNILLSLSNDSRFKSFFSNHPDTQLRINSLQK